MLLPPVAGWLPGDSFSVGIDCDFLEWLNEVFFILGYHASENTAPVYKLRPFSAELAVAWCAGKIHPADAKNIRAFFPLLSDHFPDGTCPGLH
jgi:hypothetical protein